MAEWYLEHLQLYHRHRRRLALRQDRAAAAVHRIDYWYDGLTPPHTVHTEDHAGMFVFWVLQTACFALYSETGNIAAAHTFIAMICE